MTKLTNLKKVTLKAEHISEVVVGGRKTLSLIVPTNSFLKTDIPNHANSRDFTGNANKAVEAMKTTLLQEPEMFRLKNLGIRLVASEFTREDNNVTLYFNKEEGIFNGGHTYTVLKDKGLATAFVNVNVDLDIEQEKLVDISLALNMSKKLGDDSESNKRGAFQWIKEALPTESVSYKEGEKGDYSVKEIMKVANLYRIGRGREYADSVVQSMRSVKAIIKKNIENQQLEYTKHILPDVWELYKNIQSSDVINKNLPDKFKKQDKLVSGITLILMNGARNMTEINKNDIPRFKEGRSAKEALKLCEKLSKPIARELNKVVYADMTAEEIHRNVAFRDFVERLFLKELLK